MTSTIEETETAQAETTSKQPKGTKRALVRVQRAHVAPKKAKSGKKATPAKKAPKSPRKTTVARDGSKTATILEMLKRPGGATAEELLKATGWQAHSVRGFLSSAAKKHNVKIESSKNEAGERLYKTGK